ncbi:carbohydrate kinase [Nocardiopsis sp. RSe5-2]|uniref:Carbohydrate kinase n=1 Tax=Nocardiopsis endophytica TaxID=3018445 RepID=A0ABT4U7D6_9ACTN|nr:FGGY-family carbohydrate kinase [Nocardiopsis endophytica]MDA2812859.1 carbohydrate kinase [Nocardiopsis endophytica]
MDIGVDVGTSLTKAVAFDSRGREVDTASVPTELEHPAPGHVEQDAGAVAASVGTVVRALAARLDEPVRLLALTGQGDGLWLLDERGHPVRRALSWMDGRAAGIITEWERSGAADDVFAATGGALFPGAQAALLAWADRHEPDALDRATTAAYCKDMVFQRLTGVRATDPSEASMPFGGTPAGYTSAALRATGLEHRAGLLPPVHTGPPLAPLDAEGAALTGLPEGTPVSSGPYDLPACARGAGVVRPGDGLLIVGTTLACQVARTEVDTTGTRAGMSLATGEGSYLRAMPAMVGTAGLDWALRLTGRPVEDLESLLEGSPPGARGLRVLPYLAPSGERAPFVAPYARGELDGLSLHHGPADVVRAMCEGIAFAARHCLEAAGLEGRLTLCGGGARSRAWVEVFSAVLGRPVALAPGAQAGARGAVLAGLRTLGADVDEAAWTDAPVSADPPGALVDHYDAGYRRYLARLEASRPLWEEDAATAAAALG